MIFCAVPGALISLELHQGGRGPASRPPPVAPSPARDAARSGRAAERAGPREPASAAWGQAEAPGALGRPTVGSPLPAGAWPPVLAAGPPPLLHTSCSESPGAVPGLGPLAEDGAAAGPLYRRGSRGPGPRSWLGSGSVPAVPAPSPGRGSVSAALAPLPQGTLPHLQV